MSSAAETKLLIEQAVERFLAEVPALAQLKLTFALELRGRGDVQLYRVDLPGPEISKGLVTEAKFELSVPRSHFNELAKEGKLEHWRDAFERGFIKASGQTQILTLIAKVIERHEQRAKAARKP